MADITTKPLKTPQYGVNVASDSVQLLAVSVLGGQILMLNTSGYARGSGFAATDIPAGVAEKNVDNSAGSAGDLSVNAQRDFWFDNDTTNPITLAHLFRSYCFVVDNHTVGSSDVGGTLPMLGVPVALDSTAGKVAVCIGAVSPHAMPPAYAAEGVARGVATNLEAGAFSAGTFTATADGALATQDGLTIAVGDVLILPAGTLTTLVVSAANSGPYVVTSLGSLSSKVTLARPSWWAHGGVARASAQIKARAGTIFAGTTWRSFAAANITIGTGDPALYPERVTQRVTLVAGTKTINTIPVLSTTRLGFSTSGAIGGTPAGTTTNYAIKASSGITAGGIGTAAVIVEAQSVAGTIVNTDVAQLNVTLSNG